LVLAVSAAFPGIASDEVGERYGGWLALQIIVGELLGPRTRERFGEASFDRLGGGASGSAAKVVAGVKDSRGFAVTRERNVRSMAVEVRYATPCPSLPAS
jgi:hypothetical protein